jgi:hypothetical protein
MRERRRTFDSRACDITAQNGNGGANASRAFWTGVQSILAFNEACVEERQAWSFWFGVFR